MSGGVGGAGNQSGPDPIKKTCFASLNKYKGNPFLPMLPHGVSKGYIFMNERSHESGAGHNRLKGFLLALGSTALVSTNFVTAKYALKGFNTETFSFVWCSVATVYTFLYILLTGRLGQVRPDPRNIVRLLLLGVFTSGSMLMGWAGLRLLDPSFAAFIGRFTPAFVILLSAMFLKERIPSIEFVPIGLMITGGVAATVGRLELVLGGTLLMIGSVICNSTMMVVAKTIASEKHPGVMVFYRLAGAGTIIGIWLMASGKIDFAVAPSYWIAIFVGALLGPCVSHILLFASLKHWEVGRASVVQSVSPLLVIPMAFFAFAKLPGVKEMIGGMVILGGALWLGMMHWKSRKAG
jgi:drug/metabolite transporter (DMT)-like permease